MSELLDMAVASDVRISRERIAVDSMAQDFGPARSKDVHESGIAMTNALVSLCESLTGIITSVQKAGHLVEKLEVYNILSREQNPDGMCPCVRVTFTKKHTDE